MGRNILVFSDGTGQAGGVSVDERRSNIYKLYRATRVGPDCCVNPAEQVAFYDPGLGSRPTGGGFFSTLYRSAHNFLSQATGFGLTANIIDCYEFIIRNWQPGDCIFLFGFSRGAYTARSIGGVLALCGVPTQLENGATMKYDSATARRLATIAVKKVYQHTASKTPANATDREKELLEQRSELARQFRQTYASRQGDNSDYPYFIGVFDTVASVASKGALIILAAVVIALAAGIAAALWQGYPSIGPLFSENVSGFIAYVSELLRIDATNWWHWFYIVASAFGLVACLWYVTQQVKFAPRANPKKWWRTINISLGRMSFEDKSLNDNVRYARHAISIDENRAAFPRVPWGDPESTRRYQDEQGIITFRQYWFAGNHSDVGGSYPENEARLSDIALSWMADAAAEIKGGLKFDRSVLQLYPSPDGMQHDQRKSGFPVLTKWFRLTWPEMSRAIPNPQTTLHESVFNRFKLPTVLQYDVAAPYRREGLRTHDRLVSYYRDIPEPMVGNRFAAKIRSYFLTA